MRLETKIHLVKEKSGTEMVDIIAVESSVFAEIIQAKPEFRAVERKIIENGIDQGSILHEEPDSYNTHFEVEIGVLPKE